MLNNFTTRWVPRLAASSMAVTLLAAAWLAGTIPASANSDPHRIFAAAAPFDLPASYCGFPVRVGVVTNNEYQTVSVASDGSMVIKTTGSFVASVTNLGTGKAIDVNASGPGTITVLPDGVTAVFDTQGLGLLYAANATEFGLPSDILVTSGRAVLTANLPTDTITSLPTPPHVLLDVCSAVA